VIAAGNELHCVLRALSGALPIVFLAIDFDPHRKRLATSLRVFVGRAFLAIGKTVSGTDFGDRMGVVADCSRNPLSTYVARNRG
jgi:hypothetical protein